MRGSRLAWREPIAALRSASKLLEEGDSCDEVERRLIASVQRENFFFHIKINLSADREKRRTDWGGTATRACT